MLQLYGYYRSSAAYRVRIALHYKGLDYTHTGVNLVQSEQLERDYLAVNPQGLVPTLVTEQGEALTQSVAILEWLEESYPQQPILPPDKVGRARVRSMVNTIACEIHPLNNLRVQRYITGELGASREQGLRWYHHWLGLGFAALEQQVSGATCCWGNGVSMADICLVPQLYNARRFNMQLDEFPRLVAIGQSLESLAAFAAAAPEVQPDAP